MNSLLSTQQFNNFAKLIEEYCGIHLEQNRLDELSVSIALRAHELNLDLASYYDLLKSNDEEELKKVVSCLTINETSFMRYFQQFELLEDIVFSNYVNSNQEIYIWSAGCSSGEEPYSIAIILSELLPANKFKIIATDIDTNALRRAKRGIYEGRSLRLLSPQRLKANFKKIDSTRFAINNNIKDMVFFVQHNIATLKSPAGFSYFDIIFCRNVLIYFSKDKLARIIDLFYNIMQPKGYLFLGHSESLYTVPNNFQARQSGNVYVHQKLDKPTSLKSKSQAAWSVVEQSQDKKTPVTKQETVQETNLFRQALNYYAEKQPDKALNIIEKMPNLDFEAMLLKAQAFLEKGDFDNAKNICLDMLKKDSFSGYPYFLLGLAALKENNEQEAIENFRKAAYSVKDFALPHFFLANYYKKERNQKRALIEYNKCNELLAKPVNENIWTILSPQFAPSAIVKACNQFISKF